MNKMYLKLKKQINVYEVPQFYIKDSRKTNNIICINFMHNEISEYRYVNSVLSLDIVRYDDIDKCELLKTLLNINTSLYSDILRAIKKGINTIYLNTKFDYNNRFYDRPNIIGFKDCLRVCYNRLYVSESDIMYIDGKPCEFIHDGVLYDYRFFEHFKIGNKRQLEKIRRKKAIIRRETK